MDKGIKAFETCGIYPINPSVFTDEDFLPSTVTERHSVENQDHQINDIETHSDSDDTLPLSTLRKKIINLTSIAPTSIKSAHMTPEKQPSENLNTSPKPVHLTPIASTSLQIVELTPGTQPTTSSKDTSVDELYYCTPSTSHGVVTPQEILPLPRRSEDQRRRRVGQKSEILSSTPFKDKLEANRAEKRQKAELQAKKRAKKNISDCPKKDKCRKMKESSKQFACPGCCAEYVDPPVEDWIQCEKCLEWWHEKCTAYENGGHFICDYCE